MGPNEGRVKKKVPFSQYLCQEIIKSPSKQVSHTSEGAEKQQPKQSQGYQRKRNTQNKRENKPNRDQMNNA